MNTIYFIHFRAKANMLYFLVIFFILLTMLYGILKIWWKNHTDRLSFISGPAGVPLFGNALMQHSDPHKSFKQRQEFSRLYNGLYVLWIAHRAAVITGRPVYTEAVLSSQEILRKAFGYKFLEGWLGTGLVTSSGKKWKSRRRAITPTFHFAILKEFVCIFEKQSKRLVEKFRETADTGEAIDVQVPVSLATLDVICETSMGVHVNAQYASTSEYVEAVHSVKHELSHRIQSPWLWFPLTYPYTSSGKKYYKSLKTVKDFTVGVINKRIESRNLSKEDENNVGKKFFLDMLLDAYDKGEIDVDGIREEVDTFMFAGHDTTASALSWTLYLIGRHPEVQKKLHIEIDNASFSENILDKIRNMKYLDYVIKESLRLYPPVPRYSRVLDKDTRIDGHVLPKGTSFFIDVISTHTNPESWDDPLSFNPDRFGDEKFCKRNPYTYLPFSAGPRNCIGQKFAMLEEKIFVYFILSNFQINSVQDDKHVETYTALVLASANGLYLEFHNRK